MFTFEEPDMGATSTADLTGTWRIDPLTVDTGPMREDSAAFSMTLRSNGTFSATNIPAHMFFDWSALTEASGKWDLLPARGIPRLKLTFTNPPNFVWEHPLIWLRADPSATRKLAVQVGSRLCITKKPASGQSTTNQEMHPERPTGSGEPQHSADGSQPFNCVPIPASVAAGSHR